MTVALMFGTFQQSSLRIEVNASEQLLRKSLLYPEHLQVWLWPQHLSPGLPEHLQRGLQFSSWLGGVKVQHQVEQVDFNHLRLLLSEGIDGFQDWYWGEGWVQSQLEGISVLPLQLGLTIAMLRLRQHLEERSQPPRKASYP